MLYCKSLHLFYFFLALIAASVVKLNITALGAYNGISRFECWEIDTPFTSSNQSGIVDTKTVTLGDVSKMTYNVMPAGYNSGFHPAPSNQWVVLLSGLGVITVPGNGSTTFTTQGGAFGLLFATDTADITEKGHDSQFPGATETVFLQIPTKNNKIPKHRVLRYNQPCTAKEVSRLRSWALGD